MKKLLNTGFAYAIAAMAGGVFYREFTKFNGFTGVTALGKVHTHLFLLGMFMFLITALFAKLGPVTEQKQYKLFFAFYNIGVPLTAIMFVVRGMFQVLKVELSAVTDAMISGFAGIGHILTGVGIIFLFLCLKKAFGKSSTNE